MELLPAHQPLLEEDTDDELSDEQIRELLNEAAQRMRAKATSQPTPDAPFKLPKLNPGHIADTYEKTEGNITRLDHSKLIDKKQQALANGIKKIEDPLQVKKQRKEVRHSLVLRTGRHSRMHGWRFARDDNYPNFSLKQTRAPSWVPSCIIDAFIFIVTLRHNTCLAFDF